MAINTRIYAGGSVAFGGQPAIDDLMNAGYSAVIVWSVHVATDGTLYLNDTQIVSGGIYQEATPMDLPGRLAQLHKAGVQILFSVGAGGVNDFAHIGLFVSKGVPGKGNPLYDNFAALRQAMVTAGGDIDAIDFDNEDDMNTVIMVNFGTMLANIGYAGVTFCPYYQSQVWTDTYTQLLGAHGNGFVSAIHLQCYSGGGNETPAPWGDMIAAAGGDTLLIPGLATNQAASGWWDNKTKSPGVNVVKTPNVAMYGEANWSGMVRQGNYATADLALQAAAASGGQTFLFYCRGYLDLGPGKQFQPGDAVFFAGEPWWGSAPQCDAYSMSGGCSNIYNNNGACPSDIQTQFATWKQVPKQKHPMDGGFIWLYDSVLSCLLAGCCGGTESNPATTAKVYREAITNGLT